MQFDNLTSKGFKPKINIMDNQATKHIKAFLMKQQCNLQLVELHNHRMIAEERAIQTSRMSSLPRLPQPITNSHCHCGTKSCRKFKTHWILCKPQGEAQVSLLMKHSTAHIIGTNIPLLCWGAKQLSTKMVTPENCGYRVVLRDGTWTHQWTTTNVTCTTFPRLKHIESRVPQNCSPNTAKCQTWPCTNTLAHSAMSWPNQQKLQV